MANIIIGAIVVALICLSIAYLVKAKKKGQACFGCPNSGMCSKDCQYHNDI